MAQDLIEVMPFDYQIVEAANGRLRVEGVFQRADVENANKRVYPRGIWERITNDKGVVESLQGRSMYGELDHPPDGKTKLSRVSHIVTGLTLEKDGTVTGAAEVIENTPNGAILKALFEAGTRVGISSRGSGSVNSGVVGDDFKLTTFDFVARPSTPGATPTPGGSARHEASDATDNLVGDTTDNVSATHSVGPEDDYFQDMMQEFGAEMTVSELMEDEIDLHEFSRDVIQLHNWVTENSALLTGTALEETADAVMALSSTAVELAQNHPQQQGIVESLVQRLEESRQIIFGLTCASTAKVEEDTMDRKQFIQSRLQEAAEAADQDIQQEAEDLAAEISELSDEELTDLGLELGVIDVDDLEEDDDVEDVEHELLDDSEVAGYIEMLEGQLEEATGLVAELTQVVEEGESDIALKYEASLGVLQEAMAHYQMLQEAVGGQVKADALIENHLEQLEKGETTTQVTKSNNSVEEDIDNIEDLLDESGTATDPTMVRNVQLAEDALTKLGLN